MIRLRWRPKRRRPGFGLHKIFLPAALILLLAVLWNSYHNLTDLIAVYGENRCRNLLTRAVLDAVSENENTEKLTNFIETDEKSLLQLNSSAVRRYQATVGQALMEKLENLQTESHRVALGTILDSRLLIGRGPELAFRFIPVGGALVDIRSDLQSAGVNQVLYRVTLDLSVSVTVLLPGGTQTVHHAQQVVLEETLLSGQVPSVYAE